ncbi:RagB/SusD family nutrient uptake outer membrane protein [Algoriphagus aquimarinus]|uniref:RagB/SusD family nutrient uptake outer membrane protein n=1 Tax=Algoriphagus aquimarinus TaxID=237018 RepID=A0A5C7AHN5_9BACT|nr:RagB/SusD family nutrient uptake outer membrane protein [Algoriphagus aquimarinus]TXE04748.1 RagB/SusD family nutrient uptake outer membrane protein [Algoriphagus aquimarinus]
MKKHILVLVVICTALMQGCADFLDEKPSKDLVVPTTLDDFQGLLDAKLQGMNWFPLAGNLGSDDLFIGDGLANSLNYNLNATYFWQKDMNLPDVVDINWYYAYLKVFYANVVLEGLKAYEPENQMEQSRVKELEAMARFYRAQGHFEALIHYSEPFDPSRSDQLGVPIRLISDVTVPIGRSSMVNGFERILADLEFGLEVLPDKPTVPTRPSRWAAEAMLSRVYLNMHDYEKAYVHATDGLGIDNSLMDYKSLDSTLPYSFAIFNEEVIFYQELLFNGYMFNGQTYVNPDLVALYDSTDLRLHYLFESSAGEEGRMNFKGNYTGDFYLFGGLAVDELLLDFAESAFRIGEEEQSLEALNYLLENRYDEGFTPVTGLLGEALLEKILTERRKELVFRGNRWMDLKRLNSYPELAVNLSRSRNDREANLPVNDPRYALEIPPLEISLNPMEQNIR